MRAPEGTSSGDRNEQPGIATSTSYMTKRRTASQWCVSKSTVDRWVEKGLPYYQAPGRSLILIKPADVDAFLQRKSVKKPDLTQLVEETLQELATKQNRKAVR